VFESRQARQTEEIMKRLFHILTLAALGLVAACTSRPAQKPPVYPPAKFGVTPARITKINDQLRFVVIDFSDRVMPPVGTVVTIYRGDKRIGAVKITEPVRANFATADIMEGSLQVGDEAH
jgi:hypothetical protein